MSTRMAPIITLMRSPIMRRRARFIPIALLVFATPFLLGTGKCHDGGEGGTFFLWDIIKEVIEQIEALGDRVTALEECECEGILEPVCGDNGKTYVSPCEAECAGVGIDGLGECGSPVCGGDTGLVCEDESFCEIPAGCDEAQVGYCQEIPEVCSDELAPVCGCDGVTYANNCQRLGAGAPLDHPGACVQVPVACSVNTDCGPDEFCSQETKYEDTCETIGQCEPRPMACPRTADPVCGCDGNTYSNECEANASGTSADQPGACKPPAGATCGGEYQLLCNDDEVCLLKSTGICEEFPVGSCVPEAECKDDYDPVCGCDDNTYNNACYAILAEVQIASVGECGSPETCGGIDGVICGKGEICLFKPVKVCEEFPEGRCILEPTKCKETYDPVCGCDGNTYDNACKAALAEVQVEEGECDLKP